VASLPDHDDTDDPDVDAGNQLSLDDLVKPTDWPEAKNWVRSPSKYPTLQPISVIRLI
jgi:hypothetical protein